MRSVNVGLLAVLILWGCTHSSSDTSGTEETSTQQELAQKTASLMQKVLSPEDLNWKLDEGKKWEIEKETYQKFMQIKQQLYVVSGKMENYTEDSYKILGNEIADFLETIPTPSGPEKRAVLTVLDFTIEQADILVNGDLQSAQIAVINLSMAFDTFPEYYTPIED